MVHSYGGKGNPKNTNSQRQCCKCKHIFVLTKEFFCAHKGQPYGLAYACRQCHNKCSIDYYQTPVGRAKGLISGYRRSDKLKGIENDLTEDFVFKRIQLPCEYCGTTDRDRGLDAWDNRKGHMQNNVVPCCWPCNDIKSDVYTGEQMKKYFGPARAALDREEMDKNLANIYIDTEPNTCDTADTKQDSVLDLIEA